MIILGIDPGTATTGFSVVKKEGGTLTLMDYGCIRTKKTTPHCHRLNEIAHDVCAIIDKYHPDICAIEKLFFSKNVTTAMSVSEVRGVIIQHATARGVEIREYTPNEVKSAVTGDGKADKLQIQKMIRLLLNLSEAPKPDDAADAIAIALTCHQQKVLTQK